MTNKEVAKTIMQQIGGMALGMIGARQYVAIDQGLRFKTGRNSKGVGMITVELTPADDYTVKFYSSRGTLKSEHKERYCDELEMLIAEETGLVTAL